MALKFKEKFRALDSDTNILRKKETGEYFVGGLFLGKDDIPENYEEATEEEYNAYLEEQQKQLEAEQEKAHEEAQQQLEEDKPWVTAE